MKFFWKAISAPRQREPLRQIIFRKQSGEIHQFYVPDWMLSDSAKFIESLRVEGLEHALPVHGFAHSEEISVLEALLTSSNFPVPKKWNEAGSEFTPGHVSVTLEAPMGFEPFVRSVAKIAFHYTLKVFSDLSEMNLSLERSKSSFGAEARTAS